MVEFDAYRYDNKIGKLEIYLDGILTETTTISGIIQKAGYKYVGQV